MSTLAYAQLTRDDPSALKRWIQARRMADALRLVSPAHRLRVVDYGGGDGELTARLAEPPEAEAICFEPAVELRDQAEARLATQPRARVEPRAEALPDAWADAVFCLEVFEHLPDEESEAALGHIHRVLEPGGRLVIGVPVEVGPPALAKGLFRRLRRPGSPDARWREIVAAALGRPRPERALASLGERLPYHPFHLGFDHRRLIAKLAPRFRLEARRGSPFRWAPILCNSELYLLARRAA